MPDNKDLLQQLRLDKSPQEKTGRPAWLWPALGLLVVAGLALWLIPQLRHADGASAKKMATNTEKPAPEPVRLSTGGPEKILDASGYITARQIATVSAEVMGLITQVDVEEGMQVEKDQILALIDDTQARINFDLAKTRVTAQEAALQSLKVEYAEAQRELQRVQNLEDAGNFSSESQLTRAQTAQLRLNANIASAEAELAAARLQVAHQQSVLDNHVIRAPFAGVVTAKNAQAGEIIAPAAAGGGFTRTGICTIVDMDSLEIQVDVNEAYIGRVAENQPVSAVLDAYPDWKIPASVIAVIPTADRAKATVRVRIRILEKSSKILPDMGVKVSFLAGGSDHE
jgi:RND family efflux transporter MFP subunit